MIPVIVYEQSIHCIFYGADELKKLHTNVDFNSQRLKDINRSRSHELLHDVLRILILGCHCGLCPKLYTCICFICL